VEEHRVRPALLDRAAQRLARAEQVLLADDLVDGVRADADRQRRVGLRHTGAGARGLAGLG
jgi:hypothetical protein